jgi:hypothetical protein
MRVTMPAFSHDKTGWHARKVIPRDVRRAYSQLYGPSWEAKLALPRGTPPLQARLRFSDWLAEIETRIEAIRAAQRGEARDLTPKEARALAGEWYRWFVARHEDKPGGHEYWGDILDRLVSELEDIDLEGVWGGEGANIDLEKLVKENIGAIGPYIADFAGVAQFLASVGIALKPRAYDLFIECLAPDYVNAILVLGQRARGDWTPDERPKQFPKYERPQDAVRPWQLFEQWVAARKPAPTTVLRWRVVLLELDAQFPNANSITQDQARAWIRGLISEDRSARTVRGNWLAAASKVFAYGVDEKLVRANPFKGIKVTVPKRKKLREKAFTAQEAETILKAAAAIDWKESMVASAKRWVPWLCAYSGARAGEITQLRGQDIQHVDGVWVMVLMPEAGTVKTGEARTVPLTRT